MEKQLRKLLVRSTNVDPNIQEKDYFIYISRGGCYFNAVFDNYDVAKTWARKYKGGTYDQQILLYKLDGEISDENKTLAFYNSGSDHEKEIEDFENVLVSINESKEETKDKPNVFFYIMDVEGDKYIYSNFSSLILGLNNLEREDDDWPEIVIYKYPLNATFKGDDIHHAKDFLSVEISSDGEVEKC